VRELAIRKLAYPRVVQLPLRLNHNVLTEVTFANACHYTASTLHSNAVGNFLLSSIVAGFMLLIQFTDLVWWHLQLIAHSSPVLFRSAMLHSATDDTLSGHLYWQRVKNLVHLSAVAMSSCSRDLQRLISASFSRSPAPFSASDGVLELLVWSKLGCGLAVREGVPPPPPDTPRCQ